MIEPLAQAEGLQLKIDCDRAPSIVLTDPFRLQQILTNLLGNAIRYTEVGFVQTHIPHPQLSHEQQRPRSDR